MIKLHSCVQELVLRKWPSAELFIHSDVVIHESESTITLQDQWFMSMAASSCMVSVVVYRILPLSDGRHGYCYISEYQIGRLDKDDKHMIRYLADKELCQLVQVRWSTAELIANLAVMVG